MSYDAHCHIAQTCAPLGPFENVIVMGSNAADNAELVKFAQAGRSVHKLQIASFGIHPWFSHLYTVDEASKKEHYEAALQMELNDAQLSGLPEPQRLQDLLQTWEPILGGFVGEIGLDKAFRAKAAADVGLKAKVSMAHQTKILVCQLEFAAKNGCSVSLHAVKCHGTLYDVLNTFGDISKIPYICLHSYTGSVDSAKMFLNSRFGCQLLFSFSKVHNKNERGKALLQIIPDAQILIETDLELDDYKSVEEHARDLAEIEEFVVAVKGWPNAAQLRRNWETLTKETAAGGDFGGH